jgi:hypothetical protein
MHRTRIVLVGMLGLGTLFTCTPAAAQSSGLRSVVVADLDGRTVQPFARSAAHAVVLVFVRSDCPIANRYAPDLERLRQHATAAAIDFWLVFVDPAESAATSREHLQRFGYAGRALRDPAHDLVRHTGATITPEAAVFVTDAASPRLVYRGRIDDRYTAPGRMRPAASSHDLQDVIEQVRHVPALALRQTQAVGCVIADLH